MRAIGVWRFGGPEELELLELPAPEPGENEVRIRVHAAAVNPADVSSREGMDGALGDRHLPHVPGIEGAGVIEQVGPGGDGRLHVGQRVMMLVLPFRANRGSYAEQVVLPAASVVPLPDDLDFAAGATLLMNALTARMMLDWLDLSPGQTLVVTGAAGVLGCYVVETAKAAGLHVIADAAESDIELVRSCGAGEVVLRGDDVADRIRALVPGGVPGVADCAPMHGRIVPALADGGRLAGIRPWVGEAPGRGIVAEAVFVAMRAKDTAALEEIARLAVKGVLTPRVAQVLPVTDAAEAHRRLEAGGLRGRIVLDVTAHSPAPVSDTSFGHALRDLAAADPAFPALTCGEVTLSRRELVESTRRVANRFAALGVGPGSRVTIGLPNSVELVQAILAAWWLGATPNPISAKLGAGERRAIVELAEPALVVGIPAEEAPGCPALDAADVRAAARTDPPWEGEPQAGTPWKIVASGGSTGRPKLIVAPQPATVEDKVPFGTLLHLPTGGAAVLVTGPLSHNAPFVTLTLSLVTGNHVVLMRRFDASECLALAARHRVDWMYLVPTMMLRIWRLPEEERRAADLSALRTMYHMAAPCPAWLKRAWIDWLGGEKILELYGGTEGQSITVVTGTEWLERPGTVGRPFIGEMHARDEAGQPLPPGVAGELWMRRGAGQPAAYGYIGATARAAEDGWESLGDIGYLDADGYVYLTDRIADMILVGGSNVYPAEIEAALDEHPAVRSCCVIGLPHEDLGGVPHALVELAADVPDEELLTHLRERLAPYKLPRSFERVTGPLRDDSGKVRRSALRAERLARG